MQGTGKEKKTQHAMHQGVVKIDAGEHGASCRAQGQQANPVDGQEQKGKGQRKGHQADGPGQANGAVVDVGEQGGQTDENGTDIVEHGVSWLHWQAKIDMIPP